MFKTIILGVFIATFSVVAITLVAKIVGPLPLTVHQIVTDKQQPFTVSGETKVEAIPDEAQVRLGISTVRTTVAEAQTEANQVINGISDQLQKQLGLSKEAIKTENYSVYPEYSTDPQPLVSGDARVMIAPDSNNQRIRGYRVTADLVVKMTDFDKLNQAIDLATAQGANQVGGLYFSLSDAKRDELIKDAREAAIADAQENAQELARLSGMKLGKVISVSENQGGRPPVFFRGAADLAMGSAEKSPTQIEPGLTSFTYSVALSYETL